MYFNVNFKVLFKLIKVHLLVSVTLHYVESLISMLNFPINIGLIAITIILTYLLHGAESFFRS